MAGWMDGSVRSCELSVGEKFICELRKKVEAIKTNSILFYMFTKRTPLVCVFTI